MARHHSTKNKMANPVRAPPPLPRKPALPRECVPRVVRDRVAERQKMWRGGLARVAGELVGALS